jgi:hypothetical protein
VNRTARWDVPEDRPPFTVRVSRLSDKSIKAFASKPRRRMHERPVDPTVKRRKEIEAALAALPTPVYRGPGR